MTLEQTPNRTSALKSGLALVGSVRERSIASMEGLSALGSAATHLPGALARRGCVSSQLISHHERLPVLFVHGYASGASIWHPLIQTLSHAGFGHIVTIEYNSFSCHPDTVCTQVIDEIYRACAAAGAPASTLSGTAWAACSCATFSPPRRSGRWSEPRSPSPPHIEERRWPGLPPDGAAHCCARQPRPTYGPAGATQPAGSPTTPKPIASSQPRQLDSKARVHPSPTSRSRPAGT